MGAFLELLPTELAEQIIVHLCLADIRNLRLANREARHKASGSEFERYCNKKNVDLRAPSLRRVAEAISPGSVAACLEHLTVTALIYLENGLQRVLRRKEIPASSDDPMRLRRDELGNAAARMCLPASEEDLNDARSQLLALRKESELVRQEHDSGEDLELTIRLFRTIKAHCKIHALKSLKLEIVVYRDMNTRLEPEFGANFRKVTVVATHILSIALQALQASNLDVEQFDVFHNVKHCSVQNSEMTKLQAHFPIRTMEKLKVFSASLCNRLLVLPPDWTVEDHLGLELDPDDSDIRVHDSIRRRPSTIISREEQVTALFNDLNNFSGIPMLLLHASRLEELHLHMYKASDALSRVAFAHWTPGVLNSEPIIKHIASSQLPSSMRIITLRGFNIRTEDLHKLLTKVAQLQSINLHHITLRASNQNKGRSWETIFPFLLNDLPCLTNIYLDCLFHAGGSPNNLDYVHCFAPPESAAERRRGCPTDAYWAKDLPGAGGHNALHLRTREEVLEGFRWTFLTAYIRGSPQNSSWREERRRVYGPCGTCERAGDT